MHTLKVMSTSIMYGKGRILLCHLFFHAIDLTVANIRREVQGLKWRELGGRVLRIPSFVMDDIGKKFKTDDQREAAVIDYWLLHDPLRSWRRLIHNLQWENQDDYAMRIYQYAEELTGITHMNIQFKLNTVFTLITVIRINSIRKIIVRNFRVTTFSFISMRTIYLLYIYIY